MVFTTSAPTRVDLAGGTLDLEPLYLWHAGASSVNLAINLPATVRLRPHRSSAIEIIARDRKQSIHSASWKKLPAGRLPMITTAVRYFAPASGFTLETDCRAPAGSGLGGSSALIVALVAAFRRWQGKPLDPAVILEVAKGLETAVIKVPTGYQDFPPALYGGLNAWHFSVDGVRREALRLSAGFMKILERRLVLAFTGVPHFSGTNNWEIFKRHVDGNMRVRRLFDQIRDNAQAMATALRSENLSQVARVLDRDWQTRRKLAPGVSTPRIERLLRAGKRAGVMAARVCGAGGGGCVAFLARRGKEHVVREWLKQERVVVLPYRVDHRGLIVRTIR